MNVPYSWLKGFIPNLPRVEEVVDILPQLGLGVEEVFELPAPPAGVVVGLVEEVEAIEGSDHLTACRVSDGARTYSVVCGAPNVRVGMRSALARPGVALPGAGFTVAEREVMGVASEGVLCSAKELALYDYGGGIMAFGEDAPVGAELRELWEAETVLDLEVTPNRADALSILGVARDLAAELGVSFQNPADDVALSDPGVDDGLTVKIEDPEACPRFTLQRIDGVTVAPSPVWLQRRLASLGLRPRNNVVDVTNFVTYELGQPSHAYDLDNLNENTIVVRRAEEGEQVTILTEEKLALDPNDLIITMPEGDGTKPIGMAGVIGGLHDSVNPGTVNVALEAAHFEAVTIRKTAKRHTLFTDAHYRFERGVDPNLPLVASARAAHLIAEVAGGTVHEGVTQVGGDVDSEQVSYRPSRVEFLTTLEVSLDQQQRYLEALGCTVKEQGEDDWRVTVPSWRFDLGIEEDLVEEVARLHGYEHIGESVPAMYFVPDEADTTHRKLRLLLAGLGLQETMTYIFSSEAELERASAPAPKVHLLNPQGIERSVLRTALYPGLLNAAVNNRAAPSLALFEIGRVFGDEELERLGLLLSGSWVQGGWLGDQPVDFYVIKGMLEKLADTLGVEVRLEPHQAPHLHPGVSASVVWGGEEVGTVGRLHPEIAAAYELDEVYLAELELPLTGSPLDFQDYARQPHAERDLSIIAPKEVSYAALAEIAKEAAGEQLESVTPFDVYEGKQVEEGSRSVALRFWFRHPERSLKDAEVDGFMANIIAAVNEAGYAIRQ